MIALLVGGLVLLAWGLVQTLFVDRLTPFLQRLGRGRWGRLFVAEPENKALTVRFGVTTIVVGLVLIVVAILKM